MTSQEVEPLYCYLCELQRLFDEAFPAPSWGLSKAEPAVMNVELAVQKGAHA